MHREQVMEHSVIQEKKEYIFQCIKHLRPIDVAVILTSITALYLFRLQDGHELEPIWQLKQPALNQDNLYVPPLITDIDGNGLKELIIVSGDKIEVFVHHLNDFDEVHNDDETTQGVLYHLHLKSELKFSEILDQSTVYPIAMNCGCATTSHNGLCPQLLAVVWSDWSVTLLSHQLKILWKSRPFKLMLSEKLKITEMSVLVVEPNSSDFSEHGLVILGGVVNIKEHHIMDSRQDEVIPTMPSEMSEEISKDRAGVEPNITHHILDPELAKFVGHFTTYALDGQTGEMKWKHEPGDFEPVQSDVERHHHFKLRLKKKRFHKGEVHWKKFSHSLLKHLPYFWENSADITLGYFKTSFSSASTHSTEHISPKQLKTFLGKPQKSAELLDSERSNTVVLRHRQAIEVLSLENGSPVCVLPLDVTNRVNVGDVNGDGVIDSIKTYIYQDLTSEDSSLPSCYIVATDVSTSSLVHFNSSMCETSSLFGYVNAIRLPRFTKLSHLAPLLVQPIERSSGIYHHILGYGLTQTTTGMESFVLLSSGSLSAFDPSGRFLWQVDTGIAWSENDNKHISMKPISLNSEGTKDTLVILGSRDIVVISLVDGSILSTHSLPCLSIQSLISGDIDNDIDEEFLIRCTDRYVGFSLKRYNRIGLTILLYSGICCLVGFLLLVIKFIEKEDQALDTIESIMETLRLFPKQSTPRF